MGGAGGLGAAGGTVGGGGAGGEGGVVTCLPGEVLVCGSDVGECATGIRECVDGFFGPCQGAIEPIDELCNALDDDCDGQIDNGFGLGQACDGFDSDFCFDDEMTCDGCSLGPNNDETCNGIDDNCNGITDSDCDFGDCQPSLLVTGSTPSSPNCINFPVEKGSTGMIQYPCTGGPVAAVLGSISFTGAVNNGQVLLTGTEQLIGPDNCLWQMDHEIQGSISSGTLSYSYWETLLSPPPGCWSPCTEVGAVAVQW
ncbi:MAG: hypothetical protein DRI90_20400 [Deltaproteobacteria bacterium]|nr:MAG: hypothetical protein DRI90_20400 [Deltaproteobacteria bacterium]